MIELVRLVAAAVIEQAKPPSSVRERHRLGEPCGRINQRDEVCVVLDDSQLRSHPRDPRRGAYVPRAIDGRISAARVAHLDAPHHARGQRGIVTRTYAAGYGDGRHRETVSRRTATPAAYRGGRSARGV